MVNINSLKKLHSLQKYKHKHTIYLDIYLRVLVIIISNLLCYRKEYIYIDTHTETIELRDETRIEQTTLVLSCVKKEKKFGSLNIP